MFDRVATSIIVLLLVTAIWCVRNALEETSAASGWHRDDHLKLCSHWVMGCLKIGYPNIWWLYKFPHSLNNGDLGVKPCKTPIFRQGHMHFWWLRTLLVFDPLHFPLPIGSMYAIYGNIYHHYTPNVSIYTSTMDHIGYTSRADFKH